MDVHLVPGVKARDVAEAHRKDVFVQGQYGCDCITYWIDEQRESIFCLIEAPSKEAVNHMHGKSHGLIPHKIIEVNNSLVASFLGRIYDPLDAEITDDGLKVFHDPSFRVVMVMKLPDSTVIRHRLGEERAHNQMTKYYAIIRKHLKEHEGREVEDQGSGFISSFTSASKAVACALDISSNLLKDEAEVKIGVGAGEPVSKSDKLFGDTIQHTVHMCDLNRKRPVVVSPEVAELIPKDFFPERHEQLLTLTAKEHSLLTELYGHLEENWQDATFGVAELCEAMAMSQSKLYRETIGLCGAPTISLLKDFRLEKAKMLMRKNGHNISETTFSSGFTSPSYFTKCFKKKYGLLPVTYLELLHSR